MLFEVYKGKQRLMYTTDTKYIPDNATLMSMKNAGCTFKLDGKAYKVATDKKRKTTIKDSINVKQ